MGLELLSEQERGLTALGPRLLRLSMSVRSDVKGEKGCYNVRLSALMAKAVCGRERGKNAVNFVKGAAVFIGAMIAPPI